MVSIGRGFRLSPNEEAALIQKEKDRRRKLRIQQVREQEKLFARQLHNVVSKKKQEEVQALASQLQQGWVRQQRNKAEALQKLFHCNLQSIGQGHKDATEQIPKEIEKKISSIRNNRKAQERYNVALDNLHREQDVQWQKENAHIISRQTALELERARAAKVAKLPSPEKPWNMDDDGPELHTVRVTSEVGLSTTHYHVTAGYAEKASPTQQFDAREAALAESEKMEEEVEERSKEIKERHEKAVLRHKYAREKELLRQDYDHLMNELGQLEQMDRKRRQAIVATIPKQVFQPPHKRMEDRLEHQQNLEEAFEDMYMAKTDFAGDLTLALDPKPMVSDHDLDLTTESTIDTDILDPHIRQSSSTETNLSDEAVPLKEHLADTEIPSDKETSPQIAGLTTRAPVQFPVGVDRDQLDLPVLNKENKTETAEEEHPPAKKILPRSEALGRLLQRIRGQQRELSSQNEISSSTIITTSSSSRPSDLSQHPIENSNSVLPSSNSLSEHPVDKGETQQNNDGNTNCESNQSQDDMEQGKDEMKETCGDELEEPILAGSPTLLHPLEKAALIRAKANLDKQTEDQAMLFARTQQQMMELRVHQEKPKTKHSVELIDEDESNLVQNNLPIAAKRTNITGDRLQLSQPQNTQDASKRLDKLSADIQEEFLPLSSDTMFIQHGLSIPSAPIHYTTNQLQRSTSSEKTLSDLSATRSSSDFDDPLLQRIRLYQQNLLQKHSKKKQDISKEQKKLMQTTEILIDQQKQLMSRMPQLHTTANRNFASVPTTSTHPKVALKPQFKEKEMSSFQRNRISAAKPTTNQPEVSQMTDNSYSTSKQSFHNYPQSFQSIGHQESLKTSIFTQDEPQKDKGNLYKNVSMPYIQPPTKPQGDEPLGFYEEHEIRTKWLREQQELLRKQREALLQHQEMQKRSLEDKQLQLMAQLKGDIGTMKKKCVSTSQAREVASNSNELIPTADPGKVSFPKNYYECTQHKESPEKYLLEKEILDHEISSAVDNNQCTSVAESVHFQDINERTITPSTILKQRMYPPVSIPKLIPMDVQFNTHELSTIPEVDTPKHSQSAFQDEGSPHNFKSLMAEENSDISGSQVYDEFNCTANQLSPTELKQRPVITVPAYDKELNYQGEGKDEHSSKMSPQAVIDISNPVVEQDVLADDEESFLSQNEKTGYDSYSGIGKEYNDLLHFKPNEFQSSTQISDNLDSSIPVSTNPVAKSSFTSRHVWKNLLSIPASDMPIFKQESLQDYTGQDQKRKYDTSTFDSTLTSRQFLEISRELQHQLQPQRKVSSNTTALSEYTIGKNENSKVIDSQIEQSTLSEYVDNQSPAHKLSDSLSDSLSLMSGPVGEYTGQSSPLMPGSESIFHELKPDTIVQQKMSSLHSPTHATSHHRSQNVASSGYKVQTLEKLRRFEKKEEIGSSDIKDANDVSSAFRNYSYQAESPAELLHKHQLGHTGKTSLSTYSLDSIKDPYTTSQIVSTPLNPLVTGLSSYAVKEEDTEEDDLKRYMFEKPGPESKLSHLTINASDRPTNRLSEQEFDLASRQSDSPSNTENVQRFENEDVIMSRPLEEFTVSCNRDRNDENLADISDNEISKCMFQPNTRTDTSFKKDGTKQFLQLHETQDSTGSTTDSQANSDYVSRKSGAESELSQLIVNTSDSPKHRFSMLSEHNFDPAKLQFKPMNNTANVKRFEIEKDKMSRPLGKSAMSSINRERNDKSVAELSDNGNSEYMFQSLNSKPSTRTKTSSKNDVANQFHKLHETQDSTGSISGSLGFSYSADSQMSRNDPSRNKDDLKRLIQAVISRQTSNTNAGLQMFSDISFSQYSMSSDGPSLLSRDQSQLISSRTLSGLGQMSEEERMDLPNGAMPRFVRTQPSVKSQSITSDLIQQQMKHGEINTSISERHSPLTSHSKAYESSTESSEAEQYADQLNQLVQQSKQVRQHHMQQKELDLKKLERINEEYKQKEKELTQLLSQKKDEVVGILEEPDLTLVSIPDTTISEGPLWEASLSEGPISNIMSDSEIDSKLSEGQLTRSQMIGFEQGTTLSEGLLTEDGSRHLQGLSESRIVDHSASLDDISESLLSFQKHECEVATPISQKTGNLPEDIVLSTSSFQSSDTLSDGQATVSLQEAFTRHKKGFIVSSKRRQEEVKVRAEEKPPTAQTRKVKPKKKKPIKNQTSKLDGASNQNEKPSTSKISQAKTKGTSKKPLGPKDRKSAEKEKLQRTLRLYNQLEEVKKKKKEEERKQLYEENRRKMKAFHEKVQSHLKQRASQSKK
ncbi:uncharacterized protein LOC117117767 [Anneissia japonica]|uniref:uncharacterized protein LOC117117767 n=1 Tax=Anneissia japonica TaxID=1529436 RepID=UPI0014258ADE|nr:uncharacterized protein LOC117117767 [Anneissia japonica]